jgi:subtilisin family serine protease
LAPGENIVSALPNGRYGVWSGTSMSAPIVSGIAAMVKARNPNMPPHDILDRVKDTGVELDYQDVNRGRIKTSRVDAKCAVDTQLCPIVVNPNNKKK